MAKPGPWVLEKKHQVLGPELGVEMQGGVLAELAGWKGVTHLYGQFTCGGIS